MPSASAVPGMSSTPSISWISHCSLPGRTGAKPTPQLPITTVVTPCQHDGLSSGIPRHLAVVVGVHVDETGGHDQSIGVDDLPAGSAPAGPTTSVICPSSTTTSAR